MGLSELGISGQGAALVCVKDQEKLTFATKSLKEMGFASVSQALSEKEALDKMKYNEYDCIIVEDGFGGPLEESQLMQELRNMEVSQRRKIFIVLLGDRWETGNIIQAFSLSVNLVINQRLLDKLKEGLTAAMSRQYKFYKVFNDSREALGKV
jgi:hypothetical protein